MLKCERMCKRLVPIIAIVSTAVGSFFVYDNVKEILDTRLYRFLPCAGVVASIVYVISCLMLFWGSQNDEPNWMIPWLVFTWIGVICYANLFCILFEPISSILLAMVICIVNWGIVIQVFLDLKKWTRTENRDSNENSANVQASSAS